VEELILARHGESVFSERQLLNGDVSAAGPLTARGVEEARELRRALAGTAIDLCVTSEFERARQTADLALEGRDVPRLVTADLNDPRYGRYEGQALEDYRGWATAAGSELEAPGGGESRRQIVARYVRAFGMLAERPEATILAVCHSLPIAYALAARDGVPPSVRVPLVLHAHPYPFDAEELVRAADVLGGWLAAPTW
jgi:broad specificity phosphatase PhoE